MLPQGQAQLIHASSSGMPSIAIKAKVIQNFEKLHWYEGRLPVGNYLRAKGLLRDDS